MVRYTTGIQIAAPSKMYFLLSSDDCERYTSFSFSLTFSSITIISVVVICRIRFIIIFVILIIPALYLRCQSIIAIIMR